MGYVNRNIRRPWLVLDLETTAITEIDQFADDVRIDSRLKDPVKIAEARAAALEKAALDMDLARIVCTGLWASTDNAPDSITEDEHDEPWQVADAWNAITECIGHGGQIVGYNLLGYDLPLLTRRAQYLSVPHQPIDLNKYRPGAVLDLQNVLSFSGAKPFRPLAFYCRRFGIDIPDSTSGADMPALIAAGDWPAVRAHNLADLRRTQALAERLGYIGPALAERLDVLRVDVPAEAVAL
jgi:hypothetical protein